ncbi:hypothetical protein C8Q70DRAFT_944520 [Cubamyces menziesii]|nr:hypothetical protein C8Q70DRAFT_944520 [Cubamyces menziesii]
MVIHQAHQHLTPLPSSPQAPSFRDMSVRSWKTTAVHCQTAPVQRPNLGTLHVEWRGEMDHNSRKTILLPFTSGAEQHVALISASGLQLGDWCQADGLKI